MDVKFDMKSGKVWGSTTELLKTPFVEFHRIVVNSGYKCSKHKHEHKWNAFYVEHGVLEVHVFKNDYGLEDVTTLKHGDFMTIRPGEYHYFVGKTDHESIAVAFEIYYPEELSEDIVRENVGGCENGM
jgi:mannose-6-phosphate isomerase-like protein (cupin superfamily)